MSRTCGLVVAAFVICLSSACNSAGDPNGLTPKDWSQLQSDAMGTGFNAVHTGPADAAVKQWSAIVGEMAFSSPVINSSGEIIVGTTAGDLVGVGTDGSISFRRHMDECIVSSPAASAPTPPGGEGIYVVTQHRSGDSYASTLRAITSTAVRAMSDSLFGFKTTASPKLWDHFVFVPAGNTLYVFEQSNLSLVGHANGCTSPVCGSALSRSTAQPNADEIVNCVVKNRSSNLVDLKICLPTLDPHQVRGPVIQPSVAIIDNPNLLPDERYPTIFMVTALCVNSFRFNPNSLDAPLSLLWSQPIVPMDCDSFRHAMPTSPAVLYVNGGMIVVGISYDDGGNTVSAFRIDDGAPLWSFTSPDLGDIEAPPAGGLRQIYAATSNSLFVIDSNGLFVSRTPSITPVAGTALSLERVYYPTENGIASMSVDPANPDNSFENSIGNATHFGRSTPAIGKDGTLYVAMPNGKLTAYATGGVAP